MVKKQHSIKNLLKDGDSFVKSVIGLLGNCRLYDLCGKLVLIIFFSYLNNFCLLFLKNVSFVLAKNRLEKENIKVLCKF